MPSLHTGVLPYLFLSLVLLTSCSTTDIEHYKDNTPALNLATFFKGDLIASGIVKDRSGKVIRYFNANIKATWLADDELELDEDFLFSDGEQQKRIWLIKQNAQGNYFASANDVIGEWPVKTSGNAMFLKYILQIPYKGRTLNVNVDDKMYLTNSETLINESKLSKFGFHVASITLYIRKVASVSD